MTLRTTYWRQVSNWPFFRYVSRSTKRDRHRRSCELLWFLFEVVSVLSGSQLETMYKSTRAPATDFWVVHAKIFVCLLWVKKKMKTISETLSTVENSSWLSSRQPTVFALDKSCHLDLDAVAELICFENSHRLIIYVIHHAHLSTVCVHFFLIKNSCRFSPNWSILLFDTGQW